MTQHPRRPAISPWANPVRRALKAGQVCIGACSLSFPSPAVAQISAQAGFSFFYFDMEHSGLPIQAVEPLCAAARLAGITPIAGTSGITDFLISRPLDNGAMGVVVPHVSTRAETELVVNACRYVPEGTRGVLSLGPLTDYEDVPLDEWVKAHNREVLVGVKVESAQGIENIEEIAAVSGLDAILVGPGDLSTSLGVSGQYDHPSMQAAVERLLAACQRHGVAGGPHVGSAEEARAWADRGARFMSCSFDGALLLGAMTRLGQDARRLVGERML